MELFVFVRFHACAGDENDVLGALQNVILPSREEPGCISIDAFRSVRDSRLFYVHSRWENEAAFDRHAGLPHTVAFIKRVEPLIDHPLDVIRTERIACSPGR